MKSQPSFLAWRPITIVKKRGDNLNIESHGMLAQMPDVAVCRSSG